MSSVEASGERGIAIGRDAIHSIFATGDHNQFFVGNYQRLADAYLHPWPVFERVKLDRFTGRKWIEERVDAFLRENDHGVFVLEADAGLGKTAFLAHLTQQRGYIHHFVELARGLDGVAPGLKSLAAQLLRAWVLNPNTAEAVLPGSAARPEFLQNLLKEAADQRDRRRPGEPIVLVVDALDEAGTPTGQNVLGLPRILPRGVYLVVSHRPVDVTLSVEGPRHVEPLKAEDQENLADMRAFLEKALTWPGIQKALGEGRISESQFVEILLEKSRGVWIYLHYVVAEIEAGRRSPLKLEELPRDLWQYYADYWKRWREAHGQTWGSVDLPLLTTLAAAQDSLTLDALLALAGIDRKPDVSGRIGDVLDFEWTPYLAAPQRARICRAPIAFTMRAFATSSAERSIGATWRTPSGRESNALPRRPSRHTHGSLTSTSIAGAAGMRTSRPCGRSTRPGWIRWTAMVCVIWPRTWKPPEGRTTFIILCGWSGAAIRESRRVPDSRTCGTRCTSGWAIPRAT